MRASEFLDETKEEITFWMALNGFNLDDIENELESTIMSIKNNSVNVNDALLVLYHLSSVLRKILTSDVWERFMGDPDRIEILTRVKTMFDKNDEYIKLLEGK